MAARLFTANGFVANPVKEKARRSMEYLDAADLG